MTTPVRIQQSIRQLETKGLTHTQIARELGVSRTTVVKYCFASMSFQQAHQYFSAVWADGFPRSRHHAVSDVR